MSQDAHELGHAQGGVGVVDVDGDLVGEVAEGLILLVVNAQDALQRRRHQQILLLQAQPLAGEVVVGGVEHLGNGLRHGVLLQGADVVAAGEGGHVEAVGLLGAPEGQLVHLVGTVAGDIEVVGHGHDLLVAHVRHAELAVVHPLLGLAAQTHFHSVVLAGLEPHVAHVEPVVGEFHLPAVHDLLLEDAELIADGEAGGGVL